MGLAPPTGWPQRGLGPMGAHEPILMPPLQCHPQSPSTSGCVAHSGRPGASRGEPRAPRSAREGGVKDVATQPSAGASCDPHAPKYKKKGSAFNFQKLGGAFNFKNGFSESLFWGAFNSKKANSQNCRLRLIFTRVRLIFLLLLIFQV